jgi:ubiquinone/menaquinone biosynthesis C-methylase UbiE
MSTPYGQYVLETGGGILTQVEVLWGRYWYETRFQGLSPVLDLASGRCWFTIQNPAAIMALDKAPDVVEHYSGRGINIRVGDAYSIPHPDDSFNGVFCCWLFEHLQDPQAALAEVHRVLKPGGYCCIIVPTPVDMCAFYDDYTHVRPFTRRSLDQLATAVDFSRHTVTNWPWDRGSHQIYKLFGAKAAWRYVMFSEKLLRRLGIVNNRQLALEAWK